MADGTFDFWRLSRNVNRGVCSFEDALKESKNQVAPEGSTGRSKYDQVGAAVSEAYEDVQVLSSIADRGSALFFENLTAKRELRDDSQVPSLFKTSAQEALKACPQGSPFAIRWGKVVKAAEGLESPSVPDVRSQEEFPSLASLSRK
ncbi:hypothetical protein P7C73_g5118, partial [Tremellales sp. Uapishka_1]